MQNSSSPNEFWFTKLDFSARSELESAVKLRNQLIAGRGKLRLCWTPAHKGIPDLNPTKKRPHMPANITRSHQVALSRWRMGYTKATHCHLVEKTQQPTCENCNELFTTTHALFDCQTYNVERTTSGLLPEHMNGSKEGTERLYSYLIATELINKL
jgi:hypothetical protein